MKLSKPLFAPHTSLVERVWYFVLRGVAVLTLLYLILPVLAFVPRPFPPDCFGVSDSGLVAALVSEPDSVHRMADGGEEQLHRGAVSDGGGDRARHARRDRPDASALPRQGA